VLLSLSRAFSVSGRSGRGEYFVHSFVDLLFIYGLLLGVALLEGNGLEVGSGAVGFTLIAIVLLGAVFELCATIRRFHDLGHSGWYWFLLCVPIVNISFGLKLLFQKGHEDWNEYGPPPV